MKKILLIGKKDFRSNLLSSRMFIIILIFALIVIGGAYGVGHTYEPQDGDEDQYGLWVHTSILDEDGIANDVTVYLSDEWGRPRDGEEIALLDTLEEDDYPPHLMEPILTKETDDMGKVHFNNVTEFGNITEYPEADHYEFELELQFRVIDEDRVKAGMDEIYMREVVKEYSVDLSRTLEENETVDKNEISLKVEGVDGESLMQDSIDENRRLWSSEGKRVLFHAAKPNGMPDSEAELYLNQTKVAGADEYGYILYEHDEVGSIFGEVRSEYGEDQSTLFRFEEPDPAPIERGANFVLYEMNSLYLPMIIPIFSIVIAYDSVSKEKVSNSLFYLLSRPVERWKIAVGKLLGSLAAIALPMTIVNVLAIAVISIITPDTVSLYVGSTFLLGTLGLMVIYLIIQMMISTISDSTGTAILGGLGVWILFNVVYEIVNFVSGSLFGIYEGGRAYTEMVNRLSLLNPSRVYTHSTNLILSETYGDTLIGISEYLVYGVFMLWIILPLIAMLLIFKYKV